MQIGQQAFLAVLYKRIVRIQFDFIKRAARVDQKRAVLLVLVVLKREYARDRLRFGFLRLSRLFCPAFPVG